MASTAAPLRVRLGIALSLALLALAACRSQPAQPAPTPAPPPPTVADARAFYAAQPPYLRPVPHQQVPAGLPDLRASTCGACHQAIYKEWQLSTHARAWEDDPQFQAELHKGDDSASDVRWMCVNCHTPLENQLPQLVGRLKGGRLDQPVYVENPAWDAALQLEAISCATCHVRDGVILGPWGDGSRALHPVAKSEALTTEATCTACHQANAHFPEIALACVFDTGAEWAAAGMAEAGRPCQSCHMPQVERPVSALGTPARMTRRHWFGGSLIPKQPAFADELAPLTAHYPDGLAARWIDLPADLPAGQRVSLTLEYVNAEAGHRLPTGDPERFILVQISAHGPGGAQLAREEARIGTRYEWWPEVKKLEDNRLAPGEARRLSLSFVPPEAGPVTLRVKASKWRISEENLAYHRLEGRYPPGRVFIDEAQALPVR